MKVRETIGTSVRTMVKVTTDGDQHQDEGECGGYRSMGERRTAASM